MMRKLLPILMVFGVFLGSVGCQTTQKLNQHCPNLDIFGKCRGPVIATESQIANCKFLGDVHGKSIWYGIFESDGVAMAQEEALRKANKLNATHIIWTKTSSAYGGTSVSANSYSCASNLIAENSGESEPRKFKQPPQPTPETVKSGSGFFVSMSGHVITNQHIVNKCKKVTVGDNAQKQVATDVIETDRENDLALLKISSLKMASAETKSLVQKLGIKIVPLAAGGT